MRRRALLASTATLSLAATSGCLADVRRTVSGDISPDHGSSKLHPADEQYVRGSFSEGSNVRGWLFPEPPDDQTAVFTDRAMQGQYSNDLLWADGNSFVLLLEVRMAAEDAAFYNVGTSPRWSGWRGAEIPIRRSPDTSERDFDADELVCTHISKFDVEGGGAPSQATLTVRERESNARVAEYRVSEWSNEETAASQ
ncbi:lipoprotein [Haloferax larsenii JCM 13917]|nr:hypothetical protein [Haloferax larsenii]ELZ81364.1 lipoprotein [Haloferax larsenii JCM 13917]